MILRIKKLLLRWILGEVNVSSINIALSKDRMEAELLANHLRIDYLIDLEKYFE